MRPSCERVCVGGRENASHPGRVNGRGSGDLPLAAVVTATTVTAGGLAEASSSRWETIRGVARSCLRPPITEFSVLCFCMYVCQRARVL